ncbi:cobalt transporter CbiM [Desulfovibrio sp. OttesenSCG-928-A18]|nr:cobalt transporter CbiM [Desulfovibrio sp. OttesenSCG-928-A18]
MHISEGVLSGPVLGAGALAALVGLGLSLPRLPWRHIMSAGIFSAAFFVASLVHVPLGPGSVHLIMNGLLGAMLGWAAFPAITVALFLQALLFQFGGLTGLGVNASIMAWPAVLCGLLCRPFFARPGSRAPAAFVCGAMSVLLSGVLCATALAASGDDFLTTAWTILLAHLPVLVIEGILTMCIVGYLARVLPELVLPPEREAAGTGGGHVL